MQETVKQMIIRKLTSRKFWVAVSTIVSGLVLLFGYAESDAETIAGAVMIIGGCVGYMLAEGIPDAFHVGQILTGIETIFNEIRDGKDVAENGETADTECSGEN